MNAWDIIFLVILIIMTVAFVLIYTRDSKKKKSLENQLVNTRVRSIFTQEQDEGK